MSVREKSYARRSGGRGAGGRSLAVNAAFFVLILLFGILYFSSKYWAERGVQNALKACASILFVCCSLYNLLTGGCRSAGCCRLLFAGQVFACAGDIGLNYDLVVGAALCAVGHILFFAAFCALESPTFRSAAAIGVTERGYRNYERGVREPVLSTLIALADFYDLSLDELVCRER